MIALEEFLQQCLRNKIEKNAHTVELQHQTPIQGWPIFAIIATKIQPTKRLSRAGLELEPIGESMWVVTRSGEPVAELGFELLQA